MGRLRWLKEEHTQKKPRFLAVSSSDIAIPASRLQSFWRIVEQKTYCSQQCNFVAYNKDREIFCVRTRRNFLLSLLLELGCVCGLAVLELLVTTSLLFGSSCMNSNARDERMIMINRYSA